jgi:hypothetical protein
MIKINKNSTNKFILILFFLLLTEHYFKTFYNIYIIQRRPLVERMERSYGFCSQESFGYVNYILKKYNFNNEFPIIKNYTVAPDINNIFLPHGKIINTNYIIILNFEETITKKINLEIFKYKNYTANLSEYKLLDRLGNCSFFKK